jgi:hypothetical protein
LQLADNRIAVQLTRKTDARFQVEAETETDIIVDVSSVQKPTYHVIQQTGMITVLIFGEKMAPMNKRWHRDGISINQKVC